MTLRDYFAAAMLTGVMGPHLTTNSMEKIADECFQMADHMLAERAK